MVSVDTNVLVRLIAKAIERKWTRPKHILNGRLGFLIAFLAETIWVLATAYDRTRSELANIMRCCCHTNI